MNEKEELICESGIMNCEVNQVVSCINSLYSDSLLRWRLIRCLLRYCF